MWKVLQALLAADSAVPDGKLSQIKGTGASGSFKLPKVMVNSHISRVLEHLVLSSYQK